jgi:hypothetical protein
MLHNNKIGVLLALLIEMPWCCNLDCCVAVLHVLALLGLFVVEGHTSTTRVQLLCNIDKCATAAMRIMIIKSTDTHFCILCYRDSAIM